MPLAKRILYMHAMISPFSGLENLPGPRGSVVQLVTGTVTVKHGRVRRLVVVYDSTCHGFQRFFL